MKLAFLRVAVLLAAVLLANVFIPAGRAKTVLWFLVIILIILDLRRIVQNIKR